MQNPTTTQTNSTQSQVQNQDQFNTDIPELSPSCCTDLLCNLISIDTLNNPPEYAKPYKYRFLLECNTQRFYVCLNQSKRRDNYVSSYRKRTQIMPMGKMRVIPYSCLIEDKVIQYYEIEPASSTATSGTISR